MSAHRKPPPNVPADLWRRPDHAEAVMNRDVGTVLKIFRRWSGATQSEAGALVDMPQSHISDIERGVRHVTSLDVYERIIVGLGVPRDMVLGVADPAGADRSTSAAPGSGTPAARPAGAVRDDPVEHSARQSTAFLQRASARLDPLLIEQFADDVARLAVTYLTTPPAAVLPEAAALRTHAFQALDECRRPADMRELYLIAGQLSGILAYVALDLGRPDAAMANARSALLCAELAAHDRLAAWTRGTQSLIARYAGRYREAYRFLEAGLDYRAGGSAAARLASGQAQCHAHFHDAPAVHAALARAKDALADQAIPDDLTGLFTFTDARLAYYGGSSLIWLSDVDDAQVAETESTRAIALFRKAAPGQRSRSDEILAHVYLATARLLQTEIDGVVQALQPILSIPADERISWHRRRLDRLAGMLHADRYRGSAVVRHLLQQIDDFRRSPVG